MFILLAFFSIAALAQTATVTAPWLLVYDPEGRPRWEIRMEKLIRTKEGWEGEEVSVTLFFEGMPAIYVRASHLSADPLGRNWSLAGGISGEGQGFSFTAEEARWANVLVLCDFAAKEEGLGITAKEVHWELSGTMELFSAQVVASGWTLVFPYGKFAEHVLIAEDVEALGHGLKVKADFLEFRAEERRAKFLEAKVVRCS